MNKMLSFVAKLIADAIGVNKEGSIDKLTTIGFVNNNSGLVNQ